MKNGEIVIRKLPERMNRPESIRYYNDKLQKVWQQATYKYKQLPDRI